MIAKNIRKQAQELRDDLINRKDGMSFVDLSISGLVAWGRLNTLLLYWDDISGTEYHLTDMTDTINELKNEVKNYQILHKGPQI